MAWAVESDPAVAPLSIGYSSIVPETSAITNKYQLSMMNFTKVFLIGKLCNFRMTGFSLFT